MRLSPHPRGLHWELDANGITGGGDGRRSEDSEALALTQTGLSLTGFNGFVEAIYQRPPFREILGNVRATVTKNIVTMNSLIFQCILIMNSKIIQRLINVDKKINL